MPPKQGIPDPAVANQGSTKTSSATFMAMPEILSGNRNTQIPDWFVQALGARNEVLLKAPPHFSGSYAEDPKAFIIEFDKAAKANRWSSVDRCMDILPSCFSGLAEEWFHELMIQRPVFSCFLTDPSALDSSFEEVFLKRFLTPELLREFRSRCASRRQTASESGISYYLEKLASIKMADPKSDWDEGTRMSMVIEGLEEERRKFVDLRNPKDLNELREAISRADLYAISNPMLRLEKDVRELKDLLLSVLDKQSSPSSQRRVHFDTPPALPTAHAVKSVTCYNCQQEGHISGHCRAPCGYCEKLGHISRDCPTHMRYNVPRPAKSLN